jgi:trk system potassium uptake protein
LTLEMFQRIFRQIFTPTRMIAASFALLILLGTFFLKLPFSANGESLKLVDALFIATSAVCVTGLSPVDISTKLSFFGQFAVLILMQLGGLGLMTFTTTLYFWFGQRLPITERLAIQQTLQTTPKQIKQLIVYILGFTFSIEAVGATFLFVYWTIKGEFESIGQTIWFSIFHAVAAFTHGSFALFSDSLIRFQKDFFVQFVVTSLIIAGGIGFLVAYELKSWLENKFNGKRFRLSVQTRLTLATTLGIIAIGTLLIFVSERSLAFADFTWFEALMNSYFFSVVPRTSGFNTISMTDFSGTGVLLLMMLMFVGGSSGSTAGGIKVGTFGLLIAYTLARFRGETQLNLWQRTIPQQSIDKATAVVVASATVILTATVILMFSETRGLSAADSQNKFVPVLFETISAFGTVGLSLNFTDKLSELGKVILVLVMFTGRIGAISVAIAISLREKPTQFSYAEENIMIG